MVWWPRGRQYGASAVSRLLAVQVTGREAVVVLCSRDRRRGDRLWGALPPMPVVAPWWPEAWDVVEAVRQRFGIDVTVLRLLTTSRLRMPGGTVSYLAEINPAADLSELPLTPWTAGDPLAPEPLRQSWAHPDGPRRLVAWAQDRLAAAGIALRGVPEQRKTWNLSTLWRLPTERGPVWLKAVPDFFAHEGALMQRLGPAVTPEVYAAEPGRLLLADAPGDNMETRGPALAPMVDLLTGVQAGWADRIQDLLALGVPDRRLAAEIPRIEQVVGEYEAGLDATDRADLERLLAGLATRATAIADCGVPETLTHGDFHPGNVRGQNGRFLIMDWGDSCISHPMTDELAFTRPLDPADRESAADWFMTAWRGLVPGCEPERAAELLLPLSPLIGAVAYAEFVRQIEPDERIYHIDDVCDHLTIAAAEYRARQ